jgi:hypothetical protein
LALLDRVFDLLTLGQVVEAMIGDRRMMEKDILATVRLDEPESLLLHDFLNLSNRHTSKLLHQNKLEMDCASDRQNGAGAAPGKEAKSE